MTLSSLAPRRGELLWDIGAGSGAVAIEWMLADTSLVMRAVADRGAQSRARRACIRRNAAAFGVPALLGGAWKGLAPAALEKLRRVTPDAMFESAAAPRIPA